MKNRIAQNSHLESWVLIKTKKSQKTKGIKGSQELLPMEKRGFFLKLGPMFLGK